MFKNKKVLLAYLSVCIIWGSTYLAIKIGVKDFPPMIFAGTRFVIAGLIMIAYAKMKGLRFPKGKKDLIRVSVTGLFLLTGANGLVVFAEQYIESGMVSLIVAICPLTIMIIEVVILKSFKISMGGVLGIFIGFGGVAFLVLSSSSVGNVNMFGVGLALFAPILWAIGSVYSKYNKVDGDIIPIIAYQMMAGGMGQLIIALGRNEIADMGNVSMSSFYAWIYLIFFGSIIGYSSYIYILDNMPASVAGTYAYVNPVVAVLLGALILNEPITSTVLLSTVIIIGGVVLVTQTSNRQKQDKKTKKL